MDLVRETVKNWSPTKRVKLLRALGDDPHAVVAKILSSLQILHDPPRKEDFEAYLEELVRPRSVSSLQVKLGGEELVWQICKGVWDSAHASLDSVPRHGAWQHMYFPGKQKVCTFGTSTKPNLLWTGLDSPSPSSESHAENIFSDCNSLMHLVVILGASGVGKTRTILEWGFQRNCIILTGQAETTVGGYSGSRDLLAVAQHMLKLFGSSMPITDTTALSGCIGALLFARLFFWAKCKEGRPEISSYDWMCLQLEFQRLGIKDIFEDLTVLLMNTFIVEADNLHWFEVSAMFWHMIDQLQVKLGWNGFIAIDECQEINHYLSNRFASVTFGEQQRSILNPLLVEVSKCPRTPAIVVSGTGVSLLELKSMFQSGSVKQRLEYSEVVDFKGFDSKSLMVDYANKFIETHVLDMNKIFNTYKGRYRFFVTALERYLAGQCNGGTKFFLDFATALCNSSGVQLQLFRSVRDDVMKLFNRNDPKQVSFVIDMVLGFYFGGVTEMRFLDFAAFKMVEYGIGRLAFESNDDDEVYFYEGKLPFDGDYDGFACVKIDEPIVQKSLLDFLKADTVQFDKQCIDRYVHGARNSDSKIGEDYELYAATGLGSFFNDNTPANMLPSGITEVVADVYKKQAYLVQSDDPVLACLVKDVSSEYRLLDWINAIESNGSFATYFRTGPHNDCGPDVIFILYVPHFCKYLPVLCQMKTGEEVNMREAFSSLDVDAMYMHNKVKRIIDPKDEAGVRKLGQWCATGYIQLLVTTPMTNLSGSMGKHNIVGRINPARHAKKRYSMDMPCVKPLHGIVDENNCDLFLDKWLCKAIQNLKKDTRKRRR